MSIMITSMGWEEGQLRGGTLDKPDDWDENGIQS